FLNLAAFFCITMPLMFTVGLPGYAIGMFASMAIQLVLRTFFLHQFFEGFRMLPHMWRAMAPPVPGVARGLGLRALERGQQTLAAGGPARGRRRWPGTARRGPWRREAQAARRA